MPLVFVHGVATRPTPEYLAEVEQRTALFKTLVLNSSAMARNPSWGSGAVNFTETLPWLPDPSGNQSYGTEDGTAPRVDTGLSAIAGKDVAQAVDLAIAGVLEQAIIDAGVQGQPALAAGKNITLAEAAAAYLNLKAPDETRTGVAALTGRNDAAFAAALEAQLQPRRRGYRPTAGLGMRSKADWPRSADGSATASATSCLWPSGAI